MKTYDKGILEPLFGTFRYKEVIKHINKKKPLVIVDLGCGDDMGFYNFAIKNGVVIKQYIGVDPLISNETISKYDNENKSVRFVKSSIDKKISLDKNTADYVIGLAFLEHLNNPQNIMDESIRILKKGGICIFTAPTPRAKTILEFLSYKLKLISKKLTEEHQTYFTKEKVFESLNHHKLKIEVIHKYFELGFNNLILIKKIV